MKAFTFAMCLLCACSVRTQRDPLDSTAVVVVANPAAVGTRGRVGVALAWTGGDAIRVSASALLEGLEGSVDLPLGLPADSSVLSEVAKERIPIRRVGSPVLLEVWRPRVVVFEDRDSSGAFEPRVLDGAGTDPILAADVASTVSALVDPEAVLRDASEGDLDAYYTATNGRYTRFLRTEGYSVVPSGHPITLTASGLNTAEESVRCHRMVDTGGFFGFGPRASFTTNIRVDSALDARIACGFQGENCASVDLAATPAPSLRRYNTAEQSREVQCRRNSSYESLVIRESTLDCATCECSLQVETTVFVTVPAARPPWWPCGATIDWCDAAVDIRSIAATCGQRDGG